MFWSTKILVSYHITRQHDNPEDHDFSCRRHLVSSFLQETVLYSSDTLFWFFH